MLSNIERCEKFFLPHADPELHDGQWIMEADKWVLYLLPDNVLKNADKQSAYCVTIKELLVST